jgi:hypothetical protein
VHFILFLLTFYLGFVRGVSRRNGSAGTNAALMNGRKMSG